MAQLTKIQKVVQKWVPVYQHAIEDYEEEHPHWRIEVLVSLIQWGLKSLKHYIEDPKGRKITWDDPFVELHYPVDWNWKERGNGDFVPGGHIFGTITEKNTATKKLALKTLSEMMVRQFNAMTLAEATNWAWYKKLNYYYTPILPIEISAKLSAIKNKNARREAFDELVRPFSIGATRIDASVLKLKSGQRVPNKLLESAQPMNIPGIRFTGDVNGHKFDMGLVFEIHPLVADYDTKRAYHPVVVGLAILNARLDGGEIVQDTPAGWPKRDQKEFWEDLLREMGKITARLIPQTEPEDSVILSVNSTLKIPLAHWRSENRSAEIKKITDALAQFGDVERIDVGSASKASDANRQNECPVCGWVHDTGFTQIKIGGDEPISLPGLLPDIVRLVHCAHEKGLASVSTKDSDLLKICGGYRHPCKAFDDLNHRADYKLLFDTRRRGFISLRGAVGINRNKSETGPE